MTRMTRVLVADGDVETINDVSGKLRARGFVNLLEMSGEETVARARSERPDVVVLGCSFGDLSTEQIVAGLRADATTRHTPILLAVPAGNLPTWSDAMSAQIDGFIPVPIDEDDLFTHMTAALRLKTMQSELQRREITLQELGNAPPDEVIDPTRTDDSAPVVMQINLGDTTSAVAAQIAEFAAVDSVSAISPALERLVSERPECVVLNGEPRGMLDACVDLRRNPALFHMPVLVVLPPNSPNGEEAAAYRAGASEVMRLPLDKAELHARIGIMARQERMRSHMLTAYRAKLTDNAHDSATGLYSEEFLTKHLEQLTEDAFRWDKNLSIMAISLPGMERMAKDSGAKSVESLFRQVATIVSQLVRGEDLCALLGENRIAVVLPESALEATAVTMQRVIGVISFTEFAVSGTNMPVAIRPEIGSAEFRPGDTGAELLERAVASTATSQAA